MKIRSFTYEEYEEKVKAFHGFAAPGVIIGGFMVDLAFEHMPKEGLFDVICETQKCLPDAIQLLTPCTVGNSWLTVVNIGRYALTMYDKQTGEGVRVFIDPAKLDAWPEFKAWFMKTKPKKEQDMELLRDEVKRAGSSICSVQNVKVADRFLGKKQRGGFVVCPRCKESYPASDGPMCLGCKDDDLYK